MTNKNNIPPQPSDEYTINAMDKQYGLDILVRKMRPDEMPNDGIIYFCREEGQIYTEGELYFSSFSAEGWEEDFDRDFMQEVILDTEFRKIIPGIKKFISSIEHQSYQKGRDSKRDIEEQYSELILAVENKYEGETRHETALRYIRNAEKVSEMAKENMASDSSERGK